MTNPSLTLLAVVSQQWTSPLAAVDPSTPNANANSPGGVVWSMSPFSSYLLRHKRNSWTWISLICPLRPANLKQIQSPPQLPSNPQPAIVLEEGLWLILVDWWVLFCSNIAHFTAKNILTLMHMLLWLNQYQLPPRVSKFNWTLLLHNNQPDHGYCLVPASYKPPNLHKWVVGRAFSRQNTGMHRYWTESIAAYKVHDEVVRLEGLSSTMKTSEN